MASWKNGQVYHNGHYFGVWDSYGLAGYKFRSATFSEDSRGRWYFNVVVDVEEKLSPSQGAVGVDLGLKDLATTSDGEKLEAGWWIPMGKSTSATFQAASSSKPRWPNRYSMLVGPC